MRSAEANGQGGRSEGPSDVGVNRRLQKLDNALKGVATKVDRSVAAAVRIITE